MGRRIVVVKQKKASAGYSTAHPYQYSITVE